MLEDNRRSALLEECATGGVNNRRIAGGVEDSGRMRGPGRRGQEDKDEEDERTRMRRTRMIFQDSISRKMCWRSCTRRW